MKTAIGLLLSTVALAQTAPSGPAFEVASVKPHEGALIRMGVYTSGLRLDALTTVLGLITYAYDLKNQQVVLTGEPLAAVGDIFYDVEAKAEGGQPPSQAQFRAMLRSLLDARFHLQAHKEMRETAVYGLVVGKNGSKLKPGAPDADEVSQVHVMGRNYQLVIPKGNMQKLVGMLEASGFLDRPVFDQTGLDGIYEIKLLYTPDVRANRENPDPGDINILQAVQEQLGLKLEPRKMPVEVLVVDHLEKPTAN